MDILYRKFDRGIDYLDQRKLFQLSFPEAQTTATDSHYKWKFESFPKEISQIPSYQYVAQDSEIVGYYAALPFQYKVQDKIVTCGMVCDVMTHPERRGKGIFTKIGAFATDDLKKEGVAFTSGYPIRPEVIPGHLKVGWQVTLKLPMYLRLLSVKSFLPSKLQFISKILSPILNLIQSWTLLPVKDFKYEILDRTEFLNLKDYDLFFNSWLKNQNNALIKDKLFLKWRTSAPGTNYQFVTLRHGEQLVGLAISSGTILRGIDSLAILDFMVLPDYFSGIRTLHQGLRKLAVSQKRDVIVCMASAYWAKLYKFKTSFYLPTPAVFSLIIKKLDAGIPDETLFSPKQWHLFWVDSDDL